MVRGPFICVVYLTGCHIQSVPSGASATKADHFNLSDQAQPIV